MWKFPPHHVPLPDSPEANKNGCSCPASENKGGEGTIITDEPGLPVRQFTINPNCTLHSPTSAWLPPPLIGSGN